MINQYNIQKIRILPMDKREEFRTEEEVRRYLATELIEKDGKYSYREHGMDIDNSHVLVLFQYDNSIIGYGILNNVEKEIHSGKTNCGKEHQYKGYYNFFAISIHNIDPIKYQEIHDIDETVIPFSNAKQFIDITYFDKIYKLLRQKQVEFEERRF